MIVETLFVYLPTIIAITIAFFAGVGVGLCLFGAGCFLVWKIPSLRKQVVLSLKEN